MTRADCKYHGISNIYVNYRDWIIQKYGIQFDAMDRYRQNPGLDAAFAAYVSLPTAPLEPFEIEGIEDLMAIHPKTETEVHFRNYIHKILTAQFKNTPNERLRALNIISLGSDCLPKTLLSKWGIVKSRLLGEMTMPFDLVYATPQATAKTLVDDFFGLLDPDKILIHEGLNVPWIPSNSFCFNHEGAQRFRHDNFSALIARYEERIRRFRLVLANGNTTICLWNIHCAYSQDLEEQLISATKALKRKTSGRLRVLAVLTGETTAKYANPTSYRVLRDATLTRVSNRAPEGYVFYDPTQYATEAGLRYEQGFLCALRDVIQIETGAEVSIGEDAPNFEEICVQKFRQNGSE